MTLAEILKKYNLDSSFLLGFYGGGNYGDELLLEVLQNLLSKNGNHGVSFLYQQPSSASIHHHNFGYEPVDAGSKIEVVKKLLSKKTLVVGGGGLWGMDINFNVLMMSLMLFIGRWILGKQVLLIGVGYYSSTSRLGHIGAWFAGKSANLILARDKETFDNFHRINHRTERGRDIAWSLENLDLSDYKKDLDDLEKHISIDGPTIFMTLRHFKPGFKQKFSQIIETTLEENNNTNIVVALLEPQKVDPESWRLLQNWQQKFPDIQIIDFSYNPIALYLFFQKYSSKLRYIGPQFHAILTAHLTDVPFMPISYDNKVQALLADIGIDYADQLSVSNLTPGDVRAFVSQYPGVS